MTALPRGRCPWCGRDIALRVKGRMREHVDKTVHRDRLCEGSGQLPELELFDLSEFVR